MLQAYVTEGSENTPPLAWSVFRCLGSDATQEDVDEEVADAGEDDEDEKDEEDEEDDDDEEYLECKKAGGHWPWKGFMHLADRCDGNDSHAAWQCQIPLSQVMKWGKTNYWYPHKPDQQDEKAIDTFDTVPVFCFCWECASIATRNKPSKWKCLDCGHVLYAQCSK